MARGGKGGHTSHRQPSRPHAGDRRLAGLVHRSVRPQQVPTALVGGGGGGKVSGGGGGRAQKGVKLSEFLRGRNKGVSPFSRSSGRSSAPSERGDTLRQAVKRQKTLRKTQGALFKSEDRLEANKILKRTQTTKTGTPNFPIRTMSKTQLRREGRLQRNIRGRLEEIDPIRRN